MPELKTEDKLQYTFMPFKRWYVDLNIKTGHDAHIALSQTPGDDGSNEIIEIFIGGWENTKSAIRYNRTKPDKAEAATPQILSPDEGKWFRIMWNSEGYVAVYQKESEEPFLAWRNPNFFPIKFFGIKTCWGSCGEWIVDGQNIQTADSQTYNWFPNQDNATINFEVKAKHDAHVILAGDAAEVKPLYEVFIGGWGNSKSAIRFNQEKPDVAEAETPEILSGDEFKKFWVKIKEGEVQVGRGGETEPFLSWKNPEPFPITHFGVRTSWGAEGEWRFLEDDAPAEGTTEEAAPVEPEASNEVVPEDAVPEGGDAKPPTAAPPSEEGVQWVKATGGELPEGALKGGEDNGNPLYVARAEHEEAVIPGKLLVEHKVVYIPWGGEEHSKEEYEVLVIGEDAVSWVDGTGDVIPENAIRGGTSLEGEPLYIGRATHEGAQTIGKVHPSHACLYISYGGVEINYPEYQILVKN